MYSYWKCLGMNNSALECRVTLGNESLLLNPNWICKDENVMDGNEGNYY